MLFEVDTTSSTPIYAQIVAQVKRALAAGLLRPGDALPSLREMASRLRINPLTVARAYRELEASGVVVTEHGRGTFITLRTSGLKEKYQREALAEAVNRLLEEAQHLGASPEEIRAAIEERFGVASTSDARQKPPASQQEIKGRK